MKYHLGFIYPSRDRVNKGIKKIEEEVQLAGGETSQFYFDEDWEEKVREVNQSNSINLVVGHGNTGISLHSPTQVWDELNIPLFSIIDTPYNKISGLSKHCQFRVFLCSDKQFMKLIEEIANNGKVFFFDAITTIYSNTDQLPLLADRKFDVLFVGRLGFEKINFSHFPLIWRLYSSYLARKAFFPKRFQMHEIILRRDFWFSSISAKKIKSSPVQFYDYCWRIAHLVRSNRRKFVLNEMFNLPKDIKVCYVSDSISYIQQKTDNGIEYHPFLPWSEVTELMKQSRIVINVNPFHVYALHERLLSGMALGCIPVTDKNEKIAELLEDEKVSLEIFEFKKGDLIQKVKSVLELISRGDKESAAKSNNEFAIGNYSPVNKLQEIISIYQSAFAAY